MGRFYICECGNRSCVRKIKLNKLEYLKLSRLGSVLHPDHLLDLTVYAKLVRDDAIVISSSLKSVRVVLVDKKPKPIGVRVFN